MLDAQELAKNLTITSQTFWKFLSSIFASGHVTCTAQENEAHSSAQLRGQ